MEARLLPHPDGETEWCTPMNICNHAYWNLSGDFKEKTIENHTLALNCDKYMELDENLIPTGELKDVKDTVFDFDCKDQRIGDKDRLKEGTINAGGKPGIDHPF